MQLIHKDKEKRAINDKEEIKFSSFSSFHLIIITARAKSEKQISQESTDDEDLTVRIDRKIFPKLADPKRLIDSPASFNGGELHNLAKTIYFLTFLKGRNHTITLEADEPHNSAAFESLTVYTISLNESLALKIENQAEDGDRRPWLTFVLDSLPLTSIAPTLTYSRRERDSDDVKIIIDGKTQGNILRTIKHFLWRLVGSRLPWLSPTKTETEIFTLNLSQGLHYIEFDADRMPRLHELTFNFGKQPSIPAGVPTVDNPKWTNDFYDDTAEMILARIIFGEAEGASEKAKLAVAWTIKNRVLAQRAREWGLTYHAVILKTDQYEALRKEKRLEKLRDPLNTDDEKVKGAWYESYRIAEAVIKGNLSDPTDGATNFYSTPIISIPSWATENRYKISLDNLHFYKL